VPSGREDELPPKYAIPLAATVLGIAVVGVMWQASFVEPPYVAVVLPSPAVDERAPVRATGVARATEVAVFAGGCFWGIQAVFQHIAGVTSAVSGYSGGDMPSPTYDVVATGATGYAESVEVTFDPDVVSYGTLLKVFFSVAHDPTLYDRQGPDFGSEYRSEIFFTSTDQASVANLYIAQLDAAEVYSSSILTKVAPLDAFWRAEDAHQDYATLHPNTLYVATNDRPKLANLRDMFPELWRDDPVLVLAAFGT
jgi:peptide-methionine (S)-S-oxide reductase